MADEIRVVAILHVTPDEADAVRAAALACVAPSRAEAGCHEYTFNKDGEHASRFVFIERWASRQALEEHMQTPHFKTMAAVFEGKLAQPMEVHILDPL
jgi:quinol monooxygenase YgiN